MPLSGQLSYSLAPAGIVLAELGVRPLARWLGLSAEAVSQWARPVERGGTAGFVPEKYRGRIIELAALHNKAHVITPALLASATERPTKMPNPQRQKGDRFERRVVAKLTDLGAEARRVPLSGACAGFPGDVEMWVAGSKFLVQCKISGDGSGYGRITAILERLSIFEISQTDLFAVSWSYFARLVTGRAEAPANVPVRALPSSTAVKAITGHHVLVFRKDRGEEAVILTRNALMSLLRLSYAKMHSVNTSNDLPDFLRVGSWRHRTAVAAE